MADFFKTPAPPGRPVAAAPRPPLLSLWRLDAAGRATCRWIAADA